MYGFEYVAPETLDDALGLVREHGDDAKILAGGQSLIPILHYRLARPRVVIDINSLPLGDVTADDGRLRIGALVRYHELEESDTIARRCPVLAEAARLIGNVRVRTLGTVGGSLAHADPAAELPAVMTALDARLAVASASGRRTLAAREFFTGPLTTVLAPGEIVTGVEVAAMPAHGWAVEELSRRAGDFAIVAVVALVSLDRLGRVDDARLAFGGVADRPMHSRAPPRSRATRSLRPPTRSCPARIGATWPGCSAAARWVAPSSARADDRAARPQRQAARGRRAPQPDAARAAARDARHLRRQGRLRRGRVRRLHGAARRPAGVVVPGAGRRLARPRGDDAAGPRARRRPAPAAGRVRAPRRRAVRLLHARNAPDRARLPGARAAPRPRRHPRRARRQPLPLHGLHEDRRRRRGLRARGASSWTPPCCARLTRRRGSRGSTRRAPPPWPASPWC